jgi:hypothetical protein
VYNYTRRGWTYPRIVREAVKLAAMLLSLPVPGEGGWSLVRRNDPAHWTEAERTELIERFRQIHEDLAAEKRKRFKQAREEILARRKQS